MTAEVDHRIRLPAVSAEIFVATRDIAEQLVSKVSNGRLVSLDNMVDKAAMKRKLAIALRELGTLTLCDCLGGW